MPIPNYVRPQLTIEQILQSTPDATRDRLVAVVIGRQYLLNRYLKEDNIYSVGFSTTGFTGGSTAGIPLKVYNTTTETYDAIDTDDYTVVTGDVDVYIEDGEAIVFSSVSGSVLGRGNWTIKSDVEPNILVLDTDLGKFTASATSELYSSFNGRGINVGDVFYVIGTTGTAARRRVVTAVEAQEVTLSGPAVSTAFATPVEPTLSAAVGGATFVGLSSTAGLAANMPVISISGSTSVFAENTYVTAVSSTGATLSLGVTGLSGATVSFANVISGLEITTPITAALPTSEWTLDWDNGQVEVTANAQITVTEMDTAYELCDLKDGKGDLYVSYRALKEVVSTEGLILIENVSDIVDELGVIAMDNELAFGANECLSGANGKSIYALRVEADTVESYAAGLQKIESTDGVYALCPLTSDTEVKQAVASHCSSMSAKDVKNFRRCYVGTDSPGEYVAKARADDLVTKISVEITVDDSGYFLEVLTADIDLTTLNLAEGDIVKIINSSADYTGAEYEILEVTSADSAYLSTGPVGNGTYTLFAEFWKADTPDSQVDYIADISASLANRRAVNVWVENATRLLDDIRTVIPNKFVAAEVAGLRTAVIPWQGLTMTEIASVTDAPAMYTRYNRLQLDEAAAAGTFVITQEAESGAVFIRHQLTTQTADGSLAYEDSVGVSLDFISFKVKDALGSFVGRKNVTRQTLTEIYNTVWDILNTATTADANVSYGPQLNGFTNRAGELNKINVDVHATLKDRVVVYAKLLMPLPLNNLEVILDASVDFAL